MPVAFAGTSDRAVQEKKLLWYFWDSSPLKTPETWIRFLES